MQFCNITCNLDSVKRSTSSGLVYIWTTLLKVNGRDDTPEIIRLDRPDDGSNTSVMFIGLLIVLSAYIRAIEDNECCTGGQYGKPV